ncbi:MAG: zinc-ribbon domain-containing protein [Candidatus Heimdallarchaeota archaeon]|nr:MAG: zinc-ribbon domain-containing protein [Candidatus Heimdallarchaeota archaeon]
MSQKVNHCPYCGSSIESGSQFCQNCGASISGAAAPGKPAQPAPAPMPPQESYGTTPAYEQPTTTVYTPQKKDDSTGLISLIFGILSCVGFLPCIGSIVAIVMGHNAKSKGESQYGSIGLVLGYLGIGLYVVGIAIYLIVFFAFGLW